MPGLSGLLKILSPVFPFALVGGALLGLLNGLREMKKYAAATIIQSFLMVVITVALIYYGFGVAGAVIGVVLASVGYCLFLIWTTRKYFGITFSNYSQTTKKLLKFGAQIFGANAINMINYQADTLLIGYFLTATDVGHYAVAVGLSRFFWIIPQAVQTITYPTTSEYWTKNNHAALQKMIAKSMKNTACVLLPIGLGVGFFAREIITFIFGEEFIYAVLPLQILLIGTSINGSTSRAIGGSLSAVGRPDLDLKKVSISALSNIILNILLIPYFGIVGAAIATAVSLSITSALGMFLIIKTVQIKIDFKWYTKTLLVTLLFIFIYMCFGCTYLLSFTFVVAYVFTIIIFLVGREEKEMFKRLLFNLKSKFE